MAVMLVLLALALHSLVASGEYAPTWKSLDTRPNPPWYDEAKVGIFMHWGVFSVPSFGSEWFWTDWASGHKAYVDFMKKNYRPGFTYADFAPQFTAEFFDANHWADLLKASGAKYFVLTSKHHEGFCNWDTEYSFNWNSVAVGPKRNLVGELATAIRSRTNITFGLYHSLYEWYNPLYLKDKKNHFKTNHFVQQKTMPELYELINKYKPELIWSDGDWEAPDWYWNSTKFIAWLYNESPVKDTIVVNDRWGSGTACKHGGYYTCSDRFNPGVLQKHKWENAMTIDKKSWGFRREATLSDYIDIHSLITLLAETVSCGGNLLMNIGPRKDGTISPIFEERLRQFGSWMGVNGEAIYASKPWTYQNDTVTKGVWYTSKGSDVYAVVLSWPTSGFVTLGVVSAAHSTKVTMLGYSGTLIWQKNPNSGTDVRMPIIAVNQLPCQWAWVLKITGL